MPVTPGADAEPDDVEGTDAKDSDSDAEDTDAATSDEADDTDEDAEDVEESGLLNRKRTKTERHKRPWRLYLRRGALPLLLVASLAVSGLLGWKVWQEHQVKLAGQQAQQAAVAYAQVLTSIDSNKVDENFRQVLDGATGEFKDMYTQSSVQLRQLLIDNKASAHGVVVDSAIQSESTNKVVVLVFIDQTVANSASPDPRIDRSRIKMTMEKVDGRWRASKVQLLSIRRLFAVVVLTGAATLFSSVTAHASAPSFCGELGGSWDGQYCRASVTSERNAVRDIKVAVPDDLVDNPTTGPVIRDYLRTLINNWRNANVHMAADSYGEENFEVFRHANLLSVVFHEDYHADGPQPNNAYRTFTFDMAAGRRVQLADLTTSNPLTAIPPLAAPFIDTALNQAPPPRDPGSYPFQLDRWTPDKVYSGAYKAWALTPDELIIYMPDYPVGHDEPIDFTPGRMQWYMDGGTVQAHIPLAALTSVLRV